MLIILILIYIAAGIHSAYYLHTKADKPSILQIIMCVFIPGASHYATYTVYDKKQTQTTQVFCPNCREELISTGSFIKDVYIGKRNIVHYLCTNCQSESFYDFDHLAPLRLPIDDTDTIVEEYKKCHH